MGGLAGLEDPEIIFWGESSSLSIQKGRVLINLFQKKFTSRFSIP